MKIRTATLNGSALNWAVESLESYSGSIWNKVARALSRTPGKYLIPYSTDWAYCGPIIERELIDLKFGGNSDSCEEWGASYADYSSEGYGETPIIAAMRCYVAGKLGDEVDIPDEVLLNTDYE